MQNAISKLPPGEIELLRAKLAQEAVERARVLHEKALTERAVAFSAASDAGKTQREIADAVAISQPRVGQILGGAR